MRGGADVFLLLLFFLLGCLDGVEGDLDLRGVVEAELRRHGDRMGGGGGRALPLKGYGVISLFLDSSHLYIGLGVP